MKGPVRKEYTGGSPRKCSLCQSPWSLDVRKVARYNEIDSSILLVQINVITAERHRHTYSKAYKSIMTVTVVEEEKTAVRWRQMLSDVRLEVRRM